MKEINPRMITIIKYQHRALIVNAIIATVFSIYICNELFESIFASFFTSLIVAAICNKALGFLSLWFLRKVMYGSNVKEMISDANDVIEIIQTSNEQSPKQPNRINFTIVNTPEAPIGSYMDSQFFEWLDVQGADGVVRHCSFVGTMDISRGLSREIPDGCFLLPPGIIYQVEKP